MNKKHKKTILIFSAFYEPFEGGAERYVKEIIKRLKEKYNFIILTSQLSFKLPKYEERNGVNIYRLGIGTKLDKYLFPILALFKSFSIKRDLIHAVLESYAGLSLFFYQVLNKKPPTLLTLQSGWVKMPKFLFKKIHQAPDKIQAISNALAKRAQEFGAKNVEVVPNGIDLNLFSQDLKIKKEKFRIVCVSHLKKVKGLRYLIESLPEVLAKFPQAKLILIGEGPERKNLEFQIARLGLQDRVELKGKLINQAIPEELQKAEVFVLPSLSEGLGISILEAQACGVPVIASKVGGILDIIEDRKTGILIEPKNLGQVTQAIIKIFSQPEFAQKLTQNAKDGLEKYDWQNIAQKINRIYQNLIK